MKPAGTRRVTAGDGTTGGTAGTSAISPCGLSPRHLLAWKAGIQVTRRSLASTAARFVESAALEKIASAQSEQASRVLPRSRHFGQAAGSGSTGFEQQHAPGARPHLPQSSGAVVSGGGGGVS
jgi:hypothetical protein